MTVKATQITNTSNSVVNLATESGVIELQPGQTVKNVTLEESTVTEQKGSLKAMIRLKD
jgi:hypothetical protein